MNQPDAGELIPETRDLRKLRFRTPGAAKSKRGGLRVIYHWWDAGLQFWLFTLHDKDQLSDLSAVQRRALKALVKAKLDARSTR